MRFLWQRGSAAKAAVGAAAPCPCPTQRAAAAGQRARVHAAFARRGLLRYNEKILAPTYRAHWVGRSALSGGRQRVGVRIEGRHSVSVARAATRSDLLAFRRHPPKRYEESCCLQECDSRWIPVKAVKRCTHYSNWSISAEASYQVNSTHVTCPDVQHDVPSTY